MNWRSLPFLLIPLILGVSSTGTLAAPAIKRNVLLVLVAVLKQKLAAYPEPVRPGQKPTRAAPQGDE